MKIVPIFVLLALLVGCSTINSPTPEEEHFLMYRSDYQSVVELARNNELEPDLPDCRAGFALPSQYQHTSDAHCLFVFQNDDENLVVEFYPFDWYQPIHYVENPNGTPRFPCAYDGFVKVTIDDNWYICHREWN